MARLAEILRCPHCGFQVRGYPAQYLPRRTVLCPMCRGETPLSAEDRLRLKRLEAAGRGSGSGDGGAPRPRRGTFTLGPWLPFPPLDWTQVPEGPGVYALAEQQATILAIAGTRTLRETLQDLAADPPLPLRDLATHLWIEATAEPVRRRGGLIAALFAHTGAFPPCNRRHPRYPVRLPAWWARQGLTERLPAETLNVSTAGLLLTLEHPPDPGADILVRVETPFGLVAAEGRIAWTGGEDAARRAGVALTRLRGSDDRVRWERLIGRLAERVAHA